MGLSLTRRRWVLAVAGLATGSLLAGCPTMRTWDVQETLRAYRLPRKVTVYVAISPEVAAVNDQGQVEAVVDGIERRLRETGRDVTIEGARPGEAAPTPRVELQFRSVRPGATSEWIAPGTLLVPIATGVATAALAYYDRAEMIVDVYAILPNGSPAFRGRIESTHTGAVTGWNPAGAAEGTGESIANALLE
jgi:hypothetical protein